MDWYRLQKLTNILCTVSFFTVWDLISLTLMWTSWTPEFRTFNGNDFDSANTQNTCYINTTTNINEAWYLAKPKLSCTHTQSHWYWHTHTHTHTNTANYAQTSSLYDAEVHKFPREVESAVVWDLHLHWQHYGGTARVTRLDSNERRVVGGHSTKEVGLGYRLCLKGTNLLQWWLSCRYVLNLILNLCSHACTYTCMYGVCTCMNIKT